MESLTRTAQGMLREFTNEQIPLVIRGVQWDCWKCHSTNWVPALIHPEGYTGVYAVVQTVEGPNLAYVKECLALSDSSLAQTIKVRRSKTVGRYLSHGCPHCDALAGAFFLTEAATQVLAADRVGQLPVIAAMRRPNIEYLLLVAERDNSHWYDY